MTPLDVEALLVSLRRAAGRPDGAVQLHEPSFLGREWEYVKECLDTGWVSSVGSFVDRFEKDLASVTGVGHAVAVSSGTSGLHAALLVGGVTPGDEVLVPSLTFVATANAVAYCGAVPHFADSESRTLGLDPAKLACHLAETTRSEGGRCVNRHTGRIIRAVVVVHTFGHPADLDGLSEVCNRFGLTLIEDAAEALGTLYKGRHVGAWGRLSVLSFNGNKIVTTGGGGAILTNDRELAKAAKHLTTTAREAARWEFRHDRVGYNYRLPNLNAALGCAQLEELPRFLAAKRALAARYRDALGGVGGVSLVWEPEFGRSNFWLNALLLDEDHASERDRVLEATNASGLMTRPAWTLMHRLPMYRDCPRMDLSGAEGVERRLVNIPSSAFLGEAP